jgi:arylsulfatase A-like enzyme
MARIIYLKLLIVLLVTIVCAEGRPNVLFIAVDDMNDWTGVTGGYQGKVHTPNLERLGRMGVTFENAHTASPVCCPSRTAIMLGKRPSSSGIYNNGQWWLPHLPNATSLPMAFRKSGYRAMGAGKIFHHTAGFNPPAQWDDFQRLVFNDDPWFRGKKLNYPWSTPIAYPAGYPFSGLKGTPHEGDWGIIPDLDEASYDDARTVDYVVGELGREQNKPFFLACGIFRPHLPWYAPRKYFEMYPLDQIVLPQVMGGDLSDVPREGKQLAASRRGDFENIRKGGKWKEAVRAYLACISFADAQLGRVLDALQASDYRQNTIIVFWSDHGWHLGEKNHWHKSTLWEEATRIPFMMRVPGVTEAGTRCKRPIDTLCLYPTLMELCQLDPVQGLDGVSIVPLLRDPLMEWDVPAVTEFRRGQCAVRSERYRYIRYSDGTSELYDHSRDPGEWNNLSGKQYKEVINSLARFIPESFAPDAPSKNAYNFDPDSYSWIHRKTGLRTSGQNKK